MLRVPALRIEQKGVTLYVTAISYGELRKYAKVDYWRPDNTEGYQRPLVDRRLAEVSKYVQQEQGVLPTSILLCARDEDKVKITFEPGDKQEGATWGFLCMPEGATLWVVDGQHRFFGVQRGYEKDGAGDLESYPFPVTVMTGVDRYAEMVHFNIINTTQRKMSTDIVDRHLVMRAQREGPKMVASGRKGEKEYAMAKATRIVDKLNEAPGPWKDQIAIPGIAGRDKGLFRQHGMVASLEPALKDSFLSALSEDEVVKLLGNYWRALKAVWTDAFDSPAEYRVQATVGVYSLHMVFPSVVQLCQGDFSEGKMRQIWEATAVTANFWHKEHGDPYTIGTGMASIRALGQYLREQLPKGATVKI